MTDRPAATTAPELRRVIGLPLLVLYGLGITIGAGIYVLIGSAAEQAGLFAPTAFLAAAFVIMVYSVLKVGLVSFPGVDFTGPTAPYMAWALGFLCGFSERFAPDFIQSASGRFGDGPDPGVSS